MIILILRRKNENKPTGQNDIGIAQIKVNVS